MLLLIDRVFFKKSLLLNTQPSWFIFFLAFQIVVAMVTHTASVRLRRPAFCRTTSDRILSVSLDLDMVLAADLIDFSRSFKIPAR